MEFLDFLFDVMFYPLDPVNLVLEENPLVLSCLTILIGMSIAGILMRCFHVFFN